MSYVNLYSLNDDGKSINEQSNFPSALDVPEGAIAGVTDITVKFGPESFPSGLIYAGSDSENNVFATSSSGSKFILSNTAYPNDHPLTTDFDHRSTGNYVACFLAGTHLATPAGPIAVEHLAIGDLVLTADGRSVPVKWIGRQSVAVIFDRVAERAPIIIEAGALSALSEGETLPGRDLRLTADHALLLGGVLVQAGALVNGASIRKMTRAETGEHYTVFHIETEGHDMILAEGCGAETFVDTVSRKRFDNYAEYEVLFGEEAGAMPELDLPRVKSARQLPASLRDLIAVRRAA
jgi:hypothetical protein